METGKQCCINQNGEATKMNIFMMHKKMAGHELLATNPIQ
jgi:hypothetical protein